MSASPVFSSAVIGRPFIFSTPPFPPSTERADKSAKLLAMAGAIPKLAGVVPASRLEIRPTPEMISSGIPQLDALTGGFARGCLTEICGTASSGRTSVLLVALARATQRGEVCALVDASDSFDPASAAAAGMEMSRLLWVRCTEKFPSRRNSAAAKSDRPSGIPQATSNGRSFSRWQSRLEQLLKVTDLLLQSNGFGVMALDLGDIPASSARQIPLASWFRFRRVIEHTPTSLLVLEQQPIAGSCSSMLIRVSASRSAGKKLASSRLSNQLASLPAHSELLDQIEITAELLRSRLETKSERRPAQSITSFKSRAAWAG